MINVVEIGPHLGAEPAARHRVLRIAADRDRPSVPDLGDNAAGVGTVVRAGAPYQEGSGHWHSALNLAALVSPFGQVGDFAQRFGHVNDHGLVAAPIEDQFVVAVLLGQGHLV